MPSICLYYKVHQPYQLNHYRFDDIDISHNYEDEIADEANINQVSDESYLPANEILLDLIRKHKDQFKVTFSISGVTLELLNRHRKDVIKSFKELFATGRVELLGETYHHSLSVLHSEQEFNRQVVQHKSLAKALFGVEPIVFRNTELVYNNKLAHTISRLGFTGVLCDGVESILNGRSANKIYNSLEEDVRILLRSSTLSDDIAFRFDDQTWSEYPLTADKFAQWLHSHPQETEVINLFTDYETFGVHKKRDSGIFDFLKALPAAVLTNTTFRFASPSEVIKRSTSTDTYDVQKTISWNDKNGEACVWCENVRQNNTIKKIYSLETMVMNSGCAQAINMWGRLQAVDYFYYMTDEKKGKFYHHYLNPFTSSEEAFQNYKNIVTDFEITLIKKVISQSKRNRISNMAIVI